jgi:hypothetical protein
MSRCAKPGHARSLISVFRSSGPARQGQPGPESGHGAVHPRVLVPVCNLNSATCPRGPCQPLRSFRSFRLIHRAHRSSRRRQSSTIKHRHLEVRRWQETGSPQTPSKTMPVMSVGIGSKDGKVFENQIAAFSCTTAEYINEIDQHRPRTLPSGRRQAEGQALDQASLEGSQSLN